MFVDRYECIPLQIAHIALLYKVLKTLREIVVLQQLVMVSG